MVKSYNIINSLILLLILIAAFISVFPTIRDVEFPERSDSYDESYYLRYASFVNTNGFGGFRNLFEDYVKDRKNWFYPNPLRIFFISVSCVFVRLFGDTFKSLAYLSFFSYLLLIVTTYYFCNKLFDREKATFLSILVAFSPINMGLARRALSDSMATFLLVLSIWLFIYMLHDDKNIIKKIIFSLVFLFAILTKETSVLLIIPLAIFIVVYRLKYDKAVQLWENIFALASPALLAGLIWVFLSGSIFNLIATIKIILTSPKHQVYAIKFGSGPWFTYLIDFMVLSPWTLILSVGYIFYLLRNLNKIDAKIMYFSVVLIAMFTLLNLFTKNARYAMMLDVPIRLFSIFMLYNLIPENIKKRFAILSIAVLLICITDFFTFKEIFLVKRVGDTPSARLLWARNIIPFK